MVLLLKRTELPLVVILSLIEALYAFTLVFDKLLVSVQVSVHRVLPLLQFIQLLLLLLRKLVVLKPYSLQFRGLVLQVLVLLVKL